MRLAKPRNLPRFFPSSAVKVGAVLRRFQAILLSVSASFQRRRYWSWTLDIELGDVAGFFGLKSPKSLVEDDTESSILDPARIFRTIITHSKTGIDLLSFSDGFPQKSRALAAELKPLLALLQAEYDYIIIDTSSTLNDLVVSVLDSSHIIFLISKCNLPALRNAQRVLHGFERLGYSSSRIRLLLNRYQKGQDVGIKEVEKTLGFQVFWSIPNDYKSLIRSIQSGDPLTLQSSSIPLARSFYEMSAQVLGIPIESHPKSGGGFLVRAKDTANKSDAFDYSQSAQELVWPEQVGNSSGSSSLTESLSVALPASVKHPCPRLDAGLTSSLVVSFRADLSRKAYGQIGSSNTG